MSASNAGEGRERTASLTLCWWECKSILENSVAVSYKTKHTITLHSSSCDPGRLSHRNENIYPHDNLCTNSQGSFWCNSQQLKKTTQMESFPRWATRQTVLPHAMEHHPATERTNFAKWTGRKRSREFCWGGKKKSRKHFMTYLQN